MDEIIEALCNCPFFIGIDKKVVRDNLMTAKYQIKQYDKNEFICREDQSSIYIGIIISGCIEIKKIFSSGNNVCLFYRNKGNMFGGAVVFSSNALYPCEVFSRSKSKIMFLDKNSILEMCKNPLISENILRAFANNLFNFERRLELFSYSSIQKKIAFFLLNDIENTDRSEVYLPFTKNKWAEYLNVSRPSLYRELKKLSENRFIKINKNKITILNKDGLMRLIRQ